MKIISTRLPLRMFCWSEQTRRREKAGVRLGELSSDQRTRTLVFPTLHHTLPLPFHCMSATYPSTTPQPPPVCVCVSVFTNKGDRVKTQKLNTCEMDLLPHKIALHVSYTNYTGVLASPRNLVFWVILNCYSFMKSGCVSSSEVRNSSGQPSMCLCLTERHEDLNSQFSSFYVFLVCNIHNMLSR